MLTAEELLKRATQPADQDQPQTTQKIVYSKRGRGAPWLGWLVALMMGIALAMAVTNGAITVRPIPLVASTAQVSVGAGNPAMRPGMAATAYVVPAAAQAAPAVLPTATVELVPAAQIQPNVLPTAVVA